MKALIKQVPMKNFKPIYTASEVLDLAIEAMESRTQLAAYLEVSVSSVDKWRTTNIIPAKHACALAKLTGLGPWQIAPHVFDPVYAVTQLEMELIKAIRNAESKHKNKDILGALIRDTKLLY